MSGVMPCLATHDVGCRLGSRTRVLKPFDELLQLLLVLFSQRKLRSVLHVFLLRSSSACQMIVLAGGT